MKQLGAYLRNNSSIEKINFQTTQITDKGIEILCNDLIGNTDLKTLNFEYCHGITDKSTSNFLEAINTSSIKDIQLQGTSISQKNVEEIKKALKIPVELRNMLAEKVKLRAQDIALKEKRKRKLKLDMFLNSLEVEDNFIDNELRIMVEHQMTPVASSLLEFKDTLLTDGQIYEVALKVEKLERIWKSMKSTHDSEMFNNIPQRIDDIEKQLNNIERIEKDMANRVLLNNIEELKSKGKERDKLRSTVINDFEIIRTSIELKHQTTRSDLCKDYWKLLPNLLKEINEITKKFKSDLKEDVTQEIHAQVPLILFQQMPELQLGKSWIIDGNEMIHDVIKKMNLLNSLAHNIFESIASLNQLMRSKLIEVEERLNEIIKNKENAQEEMKIMEDKMDELKILIENQAIEQNKRNEALETVVKIGKKGEEIDDLELSINEKKVDFSKSKKTMSKAERKNLESEIKEAEKKIKTLNIEHEDLIEQLKIQCQENSGKCIFPDILEEHLSQFEQADAIPPSNDQIQIPKTLKLKSCKCEILEKIGSGGFSTVFKMKMRKRGRNREDDTTLAFKQFNIPSSSIMEGEVNMIEREIEMLEHLEHPNIVKIIGAIGDPDALDANNKLMGIGIVMDYCENKSLRELLDKNTNVNNQQQLLSMDLIIHLLFGAAQGLEYLHSHIPHEIIHGDIKSDNILIDKEYNAKLCDFGISKLQQSTMASTKGGNIGGTLAYKASETFDGKIEPCSDVYSFGCVILEMLTGERPWRELGNNPMKIMQKLYSKQQHNLSKMRKDAKVELVDLMKKCLDYDKDKRPTMKQVRMELEKIINNAVLIELDNKSDEYNKVENLFFPGGDKEGTLNRNDYRIVKIDKVTNRFAETRYNTELSNMKSIMLQGTASVSASSSSDKSIADVNEKLLFHGTSQTDPMIILNHPDAFMKDYSYAGFYGRGLYFAELARYSNAGYRYNIPNTNQHQMFICSVICGNPNEYGTTVSEQTRELSQRDLGTKYHSVHAGSHGIEPDTSCIYVVYKDIQVAARYIITYESKQ